MNLKYPSMQACIKDRLECMLACMHASASAGNEASLHACTHASKQISRHLHNHASKKAVSVPDWKAFPLVDDTELHASLNDMSRCTCFEALNTHHLCLRRQCHAGLVHANPLGLLEVS